MINLEIFNTEVLVGAINSIMQKAQYAEITDLTESEIRKCLAFDFKDEKIIFILPLLYINAICVTEMNDAGRYIYDVDFLSNKDFYNYKY